MPTVFSLSFVLFYFLFGFEGSGKTLLSSAASKSLEGNKDILAHTYVEVLFTHDSILGVLEAVIV
ncbi:hypothetical protein RND81_09G046400 [Saponaria officinalis]|uniref:Uncharacterized protein n=1 Tax=Saponaria officinalis TaxID=3572 RepID=A0AAW1IIM4_SAPOF